MSALEHSEDNAGQLPEAGGPTKRHREAKPVASLEQLQAVFSEHLHHGLVNLKDLLLPEMVTFFEMLGQSSYRAGQMFRWIYLRRATSFAEMTDLSKHLRELLPTVAAIPSLELVTPKQSQQDTTKFLFTLGDGNQVESVRMRYLEHLGPGRIAVCLSSQVGCAMGCQFCASGKLGLVRNLQAWEMVDQALHIQRMHDAAQERVANVVFMGIGEPLQNFDNLIRAIKLLNCGEGFAVGMRHIAISTCGVVPMMRKLAELALPLKLAISLHAVNDQLRSKLMPVNRKWPLAELIEACRVYQEATGRRITFEYVMLQGVNDNLADADALLQLLHGLRALVNLIPYNATEQSGFVRSTKERVRQFQERLTAAGLRCTVRREKGSDIDAACGQLRLREINRIQA